MRLFSLLCICLLCCLASNSVVGQETSPNPTMNKDRAEPIPDAIYEIRYWQNMARAGNSPVLLDTMVYFGNDRASFEYANTQCASYHCRSTDSLIYTLVPKFSSAQTEWTLGKNFIRKIKSVAVPYRGRNREVHKVFIGDLAAKNTGLGEYAFVSKEFGVIFRWNTDGEVFQLIRIDVAKNGQVHDQIDLLPLFDGIYQSELFTP